MGTVRKILDTKEQMISNIILKNANNFDLKTAWIGVKKTNLLNYLYLPVRVHKTIRFSN